VESWVRIVAAPSEGLPSLDTISMISRKSTAGGIISIHGKFFALTIAYIFCNTLVEEQVLYDGDLNHLSKTKRGRIAGILTSMPQVAVIISIEQSDLQA
jgi:hypothetical protein